MPIRCSALYIKTMLVLFLSALASVGCGRAEDVPPTASVPPTSTVAPVEVIPTEAVKAAGVFLQDSFTNSNSGWLDVKFDNYFFGYHPPDFYHVEVNSAYDSADVFYEAEFDSATVESGLLVDHTDTDQGDFRYGLALRRQGNRYYAFTISPRTGVWSVIKQSTSGAEELATGSIDTLRGLDGEIDQLRVDASGSDFVFTVNDQTLAQIHDSDYKSGQIGFVVETFDETLAHIHYDTLTVREVDKERLLQLAGIMLQDGFTNSNSGWLDVKFDNYFFGYHPPDFYHVEVNSAFDSADVFYEAEFDDVTMEATVLVDHTDTESGDFRYGLAFRRQGNRYYAFTISPRTGVWSVIKHSTSGAEELAIGAVDGLGGLVDQVDTLTVSAQKADFLFSINDEVVTALSDSDYKTGQIGFFVETFDESLAHIHYDTITIRQGESDASQ